MQSVTTLKSSSRIQWIDAGKAIAIAIVFLYHVIHFLIHRDFPLGVIEGRFVASFTIPFFFTLSGIIAKDHLPGFKIHIANLFRSLILPFLLFNIISLVILICVRFFYQGDLIFEETGSIALKIAALCFGGLPTFNGPTWFLTCLFSVQIIYFIVSPLTKTNFRLIISMIVFSILSYMIVPIFDSPNYIIKILKYFWFFPAALSAIVFFQAGILFRRSIASFLFQNNYMIIASLIVSFTVLLMTFNLNTSAFSGYWQVQLLNYLNYGNYYIFYITGFSGTIFLLCICKLIKNVPGLLSYYGENTLILLGLNGIFFHYINPVLTKLFIDHCSQMNHLLFILLCLFITLLQLALCYPFINILRNLLRSFVNKIVNYSPMEAVK